jgi:DNA-binding response OmpR family regulator
MTPRVLVVDDEPAIRHAVGRLLRREGMEVVTAATAGEALAALEKEVAHAVLLDYHLPGMSGGALGEEIVSRWPALSGRLAFVSGDPLLSAEALPAACRGARLIPKPFDLAELAAVVRALLAAATAGPSASGTAS